MHKMKRTWWIAALAVVAIPCLGLVLLASLRVGSLAVLRMTDATPTEQIVKIRLECPQIISLKCPLIIIENVR